MNEFDEFRDIEVPDQWVEILRRAETFYESDSPGGERQSARRRGRIPAALGAVAVLAAVLVGALAIDRAPEEGVVSTATDAPSSPTDASPPPTLGSTSRPTATAPLGPSTRSCTSERDLRRIGELFRSGQPTYDYSPSRDVGELIDRSTVVVTGSITTVRRRTVGRETYTVFDVADVEVLAGIGDVDGVAASSTWPIEDETDPLADLVAIEGVRFVGFLVSLPSNSAPHGWQPNVEGFAFGCATLPAEWLAQWAPEADGLTVDELAALVDASAARQEIVRPVFPPDVCQVIAARGSGLPSTGDVSFFARPSENPIAIQIIGTDETTPAEPFAWVQRSFGDDREARDVRVLDNGNGDASWDVGDGSQGYIRTRGLDEAAIREIIASLAPRPADSAFPGFSVDSDRWRSLHESMNIALMGSASSSDCRVLDAEPELEGVTLQYTVSAVNGDLILRYGAVIDRPVPLAVRVVGESVVILSGWDDPSAPSLDDVIDADIETWRVLVDQSEP